MPATAQMKAFHAANAVVAKQLFVVSKTPSTDMADWAAALRVARAEIAKTLRASAYLTNVSGALELTGAHSLVLRSLTAPPISQDQFLLICPAWSKTSEKKGTRVRPAAAAAIALAFHARRARPLTAWLDAGRAPVTQELRRLFWAVAPLIASQQLQTIQRNRAASAQEGAVVAMLDRKGWTKLAAKRLDTLGALPFMHYSHKTKFATKSLTPQEVDLALGLQGTVVLAMECKVSNDGTNSIKRVNDVIKKATAWKAHWGGFVKTAALLQGVIEPKDVYRLLDDDIEVFWSHDLGAFETWLDAYVATAATTNHQGKHAPTGAAPTQPTLSRSAPAAVRQRRTPRPPKS